MDVDGGDSAPAVAAAEWSESADEARERFEVELEFVQCLSSPRYLMCKIEARQLRGTVLHHRASAPSFSAAQLRDTAAGSELLR